VHPAMEGSSWHPSGWHLKPAGTSTARVVVMNATTSTSTTRRHLTLPPPGDRQLLNDVDESSLSNSALIVLIMRS
jgi:hypothetical protein